MSARTPFQDRDLQAARRSAVQRLGRRGEVPLGATGRIGATALRYKRSVAVVWLVLIAASGMVLPGLLRSIALPSLLVEGSSSARAAELIPRGFPHLGTEQLVVGFTSTTLRADQPAYRATLQGALRSMAAHPEIDAVQPLPPTSDQDDRNAYVLIGVTGEQALLHQRWPNYLREARAAAHRASDGRVDVGIVGFTPIMDELTRTDLQDMKRVEAVTGLALVVLVVVGLGAVGAALVPLLMVAAAALVGVGALGAAHPLLPVDSAVLMATVTVGLGLGLDYALLLLMRYRQQRAAGQAPHHAAVQATATAGATVSWCALAVILAVACVLIIPVPLVRGIVAASALATGISVAAALTLLPVLLVTLDGLLERGAMPWRRGRQATDPGWGRWSGHLMRHPWPYILGVTALLLLCAVPVLQLQPGGRFDRSALRDTGPTMARMHADGLGGVSAIALPHREGAPPVDTSLFIAGLRADPGVSLATAADNGRDLTLVTVAERPAPDSPQAAALQRRIDTMAARLLPAGQSAHVAGATRVLVDSKAEAGRLGWQAMALALACSFLLLTAAFRSLLIPVKAIAMNLLSIGAACGLMTLAVQHWGSGEVNIMVPLLTCSIVFGLSLDYEVFLVHRIAEHHRRTGDNTAAVVAGLRHTARPITLAAAVITVAFAGLMFTHRPDFRQTGMTVALAVILDVTLIRMVLVPALMRLFGEWNWWLPRPLHRLPLLGPGKERCAVQEGAARVPGDRLHHL